MKKVVFVASEATPFVKTGGLADVVGSLIRFLPQEEVVLFLPKYIFIDNQFTEKMVHRGHFWMDFDGRDIYVGIEKYLSEKQNVYFIDNQEFFSTPQAYTCDALFEIKRFSYFSKAVLSSLKYLSLQADILHCHDWQTGLIPLYLRHYFSKDKFYQSMKTLFTIHNLRFQGKWNGECVSFITGINPDYWHSSEANLLASGVRYADKITTVSHTYAQEIQTYYYGEGLAELLCQESYKLQGIINGIDIDSFNPRIDTNIFVNYDAVDFAQKRAKNKLFLQEKMGLPLSSNTFLVGMVSRLTDQKGLDLIAHVLEEMLQKEEMQWIILGSGEKRYEDMFRYFSQKYPEKISCFIGYNDELARLIYSSCDIFLMPSLFEPCGLSQMMAMRYGALPLVRETGGLKDSVIPYDENAQIGTGFSFANYNAHEMMYCMQYAHSIYLRDKKAWHSLIQRAMNIDFSWRKSAKEYQKIYRLLKEE